MANVSIPNLPSQTATTDLDLLVITDSGETTTSKITKADFLDGVGGLLVNGNGADSLTNAGNESKVTSQDGIWLQSTTPLGTGGFNQGLGAVVLGGYGDEKIRSSASYTTISNSRGADINAYNSFVGGGIFHNLVGGGYNGVIGGYQNYMGSNATHNFIGGGQNIVINDSVDYAGVIGSLNARINGDYGFIASSNVSSGYGIKSTGQNNTILGATADSQIQNQVQQSVMIASRNSNMSDGRFGVLIADNASYISNNNNTTDATAFVGIGNKECNIGINKGNFNIGGVMTTNSYNSDIGNWPTASQDISEATIIGSNNSSITAPLASSRNVAIIASENVSVADKNNVVVLGVDTYTASVDNVAVVPGMVWTNYSSFNYADDTAAAAGGVQLGQVYHNAGDLRVRIA